jgi:hypothetical protein
MNTWSVRVELAPPDDRTNAAFHELVGGLSEYDAAVALEDRGHIAVQLTVSAGTRRAAFDKADKAVAAAAADAGFSDAEVVEVQVLTMAEFEHRLELPRVPELWGPTEVAQFLEVSNPRVDQLVALHPEKLPLVTKLAGKQGARIWRASTWQRFAAGWERKTGRPKKTAPADAPTGASVG